jgi:hypothetical protein
MGPQTRTNPPLYPSVSVPQTQPQKMTHPTSSKAVHELLISAFLDHPRGVIVGALRVGEVSRWYKVQWTGWQSRLHAAVVHWVTAQLLLQAHTLPVSCMHDGLTLLASERTSYAWVKAWKAWASPPLSGCALVRRVL